MRLDLRHRRPTRCNNAMPPTWRLTFATIAFILMTIAPSGTAADTSSVPPVLEQFQSLPPHQRVEALELLAQWTVLQQLLGTLAAKDVPGSPELPTQERQQQTWQKLSVLLPRLEAAGADAADLAALQQQAREALAADLAAPHRRPSRLARALTLVNIAWFCGCMLVVVAGISLVGAYVAALALLVPLPVWEAAGYGASLWVLHHAAHSSSPATAPYIGLTGCMMLTACAGGTIALHVPERWRKSEGAAAALMGLFAAVYGAMAVRLQASLLGTVAVWWAVSALGFTILVFPFLTVIGFRSGMAYPFTASLALILAFLPFKAAPTALPTPAALRPFETGVWLWCTLVVNVANLIMAHQWWERRPRGAPLDVLAQLPLGVRLRIVAKAAGRYITSQLPSVAVIGGTLACGILLEVEQCRAVGSVFGFLWFLSKLAEFDWKKVGIAWAALAFGSVLWGSAYAVHTWPHLFMLRRS